MLDQVGSRPVGLVLNRLPRKSGINHYYYYTQHGYGDGIYGVNPEDQPAQAVDAAKV